MNYPYSLYQRFLLGKLVMMRGFGYAQPTRALSEVEGQQVMETTAT